MSQQNLERKSQEQINKVKGNIAGGDFVFAPQQIETYIETQILEISAEKVIQKELIKSSPYKGLKKFNQSDRAYFFGRDALIAKLFDAVNKSSLTFVLGASGSGKSSLVRAGLIPEFKKALDTRELYDFIFTPDRDPFESLYRCLLSEEKDYSFRKAEVKIALEAKPETIPQAIDTLKKDEEKWFVFIDQFEQLFTICTDSEKRQNFIEGIVRVAESQDSSVRIVLAMRSDFLEQLSSYPTLGAIANKNNLHLVTEMYPDELRQAIEQPAAKHGVVFELGLVEQIIKEVKGQSGYLPLLQHTLDLLWQKECTTKSTDGRLGIENRVLNKTSYVALGGVRGSLQNYVDDVYQKICQKNENGELVTKQIFLKLVNIVESDSGSRAVSRRAYRDEFVGDTMTDVLQWLIDCNLLVSNYEYSSKDEPLSLVNTTYKHKATVEIAHEILLSSWDKLKRWLEEEKEAIILKNWLAGETRRWLEAESKDKAQASDELLRGSRLEQIVEFQQENAFARLGGLTQKESEFINASLEWHQEQAKRKKARQEKELQQERKSRINAQRFSWTLGIGLIASLCLSGLAGWQWHKSRISEINALSNSAETLSASNRELDALVAGLKAGRKIQNSILEVDNKTKLKVIGGLQNIFYRVKEFNRLEGHSSNSITEELRIKIEFSPDSQIIASTGGDKTVKLRDKEGNLLHTLKGHSGFISEVKFSPDGRLIASASEDGTVKLWDRQSDLLYTLNHSDSLEDVAFSLDGRLIASASEDGTVKLWDRQGNLLHTLNHSDRVWKVRFSPDSHIITYTFNNKKRDEIVIWDRRGNLLRTLPNHSFLEFSSDGQTFVFVTKDLDNNASEIKICNREDNSLLCNKEDNSLRTLSYPEIINDVKFSPSNRIIAVTAMDNTVKLLTREGELIETIIQEHPNLNYIYRLEFSPDGRTIATVSQDKKVKLWDLGGNLLYTLEHSDNVWDVEFSPDGQIIASASNDKIELVNFQRNLLPTLNDLKNHSDDVWDVEFSPDDQIIASAKGNDTVQLWNKQGNLLHTFQVSSVSSKQGIYRWNRNVVFSPNSRIIASNVYDTIGLWNRQGELLNKFQAHSDEITDVKFSRDGQVIATASNNGTVRLWNLQGKLLHTLQGHSDDVWDVEFSPDSQIITTASRDKTVKLWNRQGKLLNRLNHSDSIWNVVFSPNGQIIATASNNGTVKLWNRQGKLLHTLQGHSNIVTYVAFSPNGQIIATASDKTVKLWNRQGKLLHTLQGHLDDVTDVAFSPNGRIIASASDDSTVKLWDRRGNLLYTLQGHSDNRELLSLKLEFSPNSNEIVSFEDDYLSGKQARLWSLDLDEVLDRGCEWARDYLTNNPRVSEEDRKLCNIAKSANSH